MSSSDTGSNSAKALRQHLGGKTVARLPDLAGSNSASNVASSSGDRYLIKLSLKDYIPNWVTFVEICERRNLFAHTGGVVSAQYIQNCKKSGIESTFVVGQRIGIDNKYFSAAVNVVCEIGMKFGHMFWRKFWKDEATIADAALNKFCFNLILERSYELAETLLKFGIDEKKKPATEELRRMMIVNYPKPNRARKGQVMSSARLAKLRVKGTLRRTRCI